MKKLRPTLTSSIIAFALALFVLIYSVTVLKQNPHVPLLFSSFILIVYGFLIGIPWKKMLKSIVDSISESIEVMVIICLIGALVGVMMSSGTVPTVIYYGLKLLSPKFFLPFVLLICSVMSVCTGSSWTTIGTIGIAFMGISSALNIPLPITAGAILCGAYFGDKQSPVSDSTNFAAGVAKTSLYAHTNSMLYTTLPAQIITLIIFTLIGLAKSSQPVSSGQITAMLNGINDAMVVNIVLLIPLILMVVMIVKKVPAIITITVTIIFCMLITIAVQEVPIKEAFDVMYSGNVGNTGVADVDRLLTRGGLTSMLSTVGLMLMSLMLAGLMQSTGIMDFILGEVSRIIKSEFSLVAVTLVSVVLLSYFASDPYLAMLIPANLFGKKYDDYNLDRSVLSRTLEDGGTLICPIVPWGTNGLYCASTLGITTLSYMPYYFLGYIDLIVALVAARTGFGMKKKYSSENE